METHTHDGHRSRLTEMIEKVGIDNVSEINAVEFVLTYVFPRGNVNPLAHRLIKQFGNFSAIVDASEDDLCKIEGINKRSAKKIKMLSDVFYYYSTCKLKKRVSLESTGEFLNFVEDINRFRPTENLFLFAIDNSFHLIETKKFDLRQVRSVGIAPFTLLGFVTSTNASYLAISHNHPNGSAYPSQDDFDALDYIEKILSDVDCRIIDSLIVGNDGIYSEKQNAFLRRFEDVSNIIQMPNVDI